MKKTKKFATLLLALVMVYSLLPTTAMAANNYVPAYDDHIQDYILARINVLHSKLDGKYFTTTGSTCGNSSCDMCNEINVVADKNGILNNLLDGFVPEASAIEKGIANHNYGEGNPYRKGWSCVAFANFAAWYIFADEPSDTVKCNCTCPDGKPVSFTKEGLQSANIKVGDVLRFSNHPEKGNIEYEGRWGHSAIFVGFTDDGIMVLDSNFRWDGDSRNCVRKHPMEYGYYNYVCVSVQRTMTRRQIRNLKLITTLLPAAVAVTTSHGHSLQMASSPFLETVQCMTMIIRVKVQTTLLGKIIVIV